MMDFRWKGQIPEVQNNMVDPQGVAATIAASKMKGYAPNGGMGGYTPAMAGRAEIDARNNEIRSEIESLQSRLEQVNARIAQIDKEIPASEQEVEIAAKRAELGDMSAYDSLVRGGSGNLASTRTAIENELKNAEKLTWALESGTKEQRAQALNEIEVALRSAEEAQEKGVELPDSYRRIQKAIAPYKNDGSNNLVGNFTELINQMKYKLSKGTLTEDDREYIETVIKPNMNSEKFDELFGFLQESKGKTVEARNKAYNAKRERKKEYERLVSLPFAEQLRIINSWSDEKKKDFEKEYSFDSKKGVVKRV
jgi:hypothetical protein